MHTLTEDKLIELFDDILAATIDDIVNPPEAVVRVRTRSTRKTYDRVRQELARIDVKAILSRRDQ